MSYATEERRSLSIRGVSRAAALAARHSRAPTMDAAHAREETAARGGETRIAPRGRTTACEDVVATTIASAEERGGLPAR